MTAINVHRAKATIAQRENYLELCLTLGIRPHIVYITWTRLEMVREIANLQRIQRNRSIDT